MNNSGNGDKFLACGSLGCISFSKETSSLDTSVDATVLSTINITSGSCTCVVTVDASNGKCGGGGSCTGASTMDGCDGERWWGWVVYT